MDLRVRNKSFLGGNESVYNGVERSEARGYMRVYSNTQTERAKILQTRKSPMLPG